MLVHIWNQIPQEMTDEEYTKFLCDNHSPVQVKIDNKMVHFLGDDFIEFNETHGKEIVMVHGKTNKYFQLGKQHLVYAVDTKKWYVQRDSYLYKFDGLHYEHKQNAIKEWCKTLPLYNGTFKYKKHFEDIDYISADKLPYHFLSAQFILNQDEEFWTRAVDQCKSEVEFSPSK